MSNREFGFREERREFLTNPSISPRPTTYSQKAVTYIIKSDLSPSPKDDFMYFNKLSACLSYIKNNNAIGKIYVAPSVSGVLQDNIILDSTFNWDGLEIDFDNSIDLNGYINITNSTSDYWNIKINANISGYIGLTNTPIVISGNDATSMVNLTFNGNITHVSTVNNLITLNNYCSLKGDIGLISNFSGDSNSAPILINGSNNYLEINELRNNAYSASVNGRGGIYFPESADNNVVKINNIFNNIGSGFINFGGGDYNTVYITNISYNVNASDIGGMIQILSNSSNNKIYVQSVTNNQIDNVQSYGGAIYINGGSSNYISIAECNNNGASTGLSQDSPKYGSVAYINATDKTKIEVGRAIAGDTYKVYGDGAAFKIENSSDTIVNVGYIEGFRADRPNYTFGLGGAFYLYGNSRTYININKVFNCYAKSHGGIICIETSDDTNVEIGEALSCQSSKGSVVWTNSNKNILNINKISSILHNTITYNGTISYNNGSNLIIGTSTKFTTDLKVKDIVKIGLEYYKVQTIVNDLELTFDRSVVETGSGSISTVSGSSVYDAGNYNSITIDHCDENGDSTDDSFVASSIISCGTSSYNKINNAYTTTIKCNYYDLGGLAFIYSSDSYYEFNNIVGFVLQYGDDGGVVYQTNSSNNFIKINSANNCSCLTSGGVVYNKNSSFCKIHINASKCGVSKALDGLFGGILYSVGSNNCEFDIIAGNIKTTSWRSAGAIYLSGSNNILKAFLYQYSSNRNGTSTINFTGNYNKIFAKIVDCGTNDDNTTYSLIKSTSTCDFCDIEIQGHDSKVGTGNKNCMDLSTLTNSKIMIHAKSCANSYTNYVLPTSGDNLITTILDV